MDRKIFGSGKRDAERIGSEDRKLTPEQQRAYPTTENAKDAESDAILSQESGTHSALDSQQGPSGESRGK